MTATFAKSIIWHRRGEKFREETIVDVAASRRVKAKREQTASYQRPAWIHRQCRMYLEACQAEAFPRITDLQIVKLGVRPFIETSPIGEEIF